MHEHAYTKRLMGTDVVISLVTSSKEVADAIAKEAFDTIGGYEERFSRFLDQSELSLLNKKKDLIVSDTFFTVLSHAYSLFQVTKGVFNPLVQIARLGYTKDFSIIKENGPTQDENTEPYNIDFTSVVMDPATRHVVLEEGQKLDFGGFLKGYLAEKLAKDIEARYPQCHGIIINIGGDIHTRGKDADNKTFVFTIDNPVTGEAYPIPLSNQSLATSGTYERVWNTKEGSTHHILDASGTQNPTTDIISASIVHHDGGTAEAYTKLFLILGFEKAVATVPASGYTYLLIMQDGTYRTNII